MRFAPDLLSVAQLDTIPRDKFLCYFALREAEVVLGGHYDFWSNFYLGWLGFLVNDHVELLISSRPFDDLVDLGAMFTWRGYLDTCFADLGDEAVEITGVLIDGIPTSKYLWTNGETVWNDSNQTVSFRNVLYMTRGLNFNCSFTITPNAFFNLLCVGLISHLYYSSFLCPRVAAIQQQVLDTGPVVNLGYATSLSTIKGIR